MMAARAREFDLFRDVLDLPIFDREERLIGRVDDIELGDGDPPRIAALLVGVPALADRLGGRLGVWLRGGYARLDEIRHGEPIRIPIERLLDLDGRVDVAMSRDEAGIGALDRWIVDVVIGKIPGADHAPR